MAGQSYSSTAVMRTRTSRIDESKEEKRERRTTQRTKTRRRWSPRKYHQFQKFILKPDDHEEYAIPE